MKIALFMVPLFLVCSVLAESLGSPSVAVGGDISKPGWVEISKEGEGLRIVLIKVGIDLENYKRNTPPAACPLRIVIIDLGKRIVLNPASDAKTIASIKLKPNAYVMVRDFRLILGELKSRRELLAKYIKLGSTDLAHEITGIAEVAHEYAQWKASIKGEEAKPIEYFLEQELRRIFSSNDGDRIVALLTLHVDSMLQQGLNYGHPRVKEAKRLVSLAKAIHSKRANTP